MSNLAPILLFCYNRLDTLKQTLESLKANTLADNSDLIIFSDAAKYEKDFIAVEKVRSYIRSINGFKSIKIIEAENNRGLANSIINGVSKVIEASKKVIVLEDDLKLAPNFLSFMNNALDTYENNEDIYSISGFIFDIDIPKNYEYDVFFTKRHCSWGWAMWKNRWEKIDWEVSDYNEFINSTQKRKKFDEIGEDLSYSLKKQMEGKINSWAIRCNYDQFKRQTYTVYPTKTMVVNLGFGVDATHTNQKFNKYKATMSEPFQKNFKFPESVFENEKILRQFKNKYSWQTRIFYSFINKIFKA